MDYEEGNLLHSVVCRAAFDSVHTNDISLLSSVISAPKYMTLTQILIALSAILDF